MKDRQMGTKKLFFVLVTNLFDIDIVKELKPPRLLLSYYYWKSRNLNDLIKDLGYKPTILLDSGAFSAKPGKNIALIDYMEYLKKNEEIISTYISLDVMQDFFISIEYYKIMKAKGFNPIPVYHYGEPEENLDYYAAAGNKLIALGGTVPIKDKKKVSKWANEISGKYSSIKFHLLGSSSNYLLENADVYSMDSSTWVMMAINGKPKEIPGKSREANRLRAIANMKKEMGLYI